MTIQELEQVIAQYGKEIYSFCYYLTGSQTLADELYQDTFLAATEKRSKLKPDGNLKSYLLSGALMQWKNRKRKFAWRNRIAPEDTFDETTDTALDTEADTLETYLKKEQRTAVRKAVANLPDKYKTPIILYYMEEMPLAEIAEVLGIPVGTVKSRLSAARKRLGAELGGYYYG